MFLYEMEDFYNEYYLFFIFQYFQLKKKCKFEIFNIWSFTKFKIR